LRYLPIINKVRQQASNSNHRQNNQQAPSQTAMNQKQAYEVLGIEPNASKEEIIRAHKRMMQKVHPDRGGSDYLAAQINQAKDTLLS
ncbi:MAG: DnaJ domain-containing protein, partial [Gammaproteobacteria bacterium]|nr:DnaJ domain-containing protein [Gammaproteobacteria bacterium]